MQKIRRVLYLDYYIQYNVYNSPRLYTLNVISCMAQAFTR